MIGNIEHSRFYRTKTGELCLVTGVTPDVTFYVTYGSDESGREHRMPTEEFAESVAEEIPTPKPPGLH